jgi:hypothetical protein
MGAGSATLDEFSFPYRDMLEFYVLENLPRVWPRISFPFD